MIICNLPNLPRDRPRFDVPDLRIAAEMPMLRRTYGKMVYELRPSADWDKGKAVEWLISNWIRPETELPVFPIYIGANTSGDCPPA